MWSAGVVAEVKLDADVRLVTDDPGVVARRDDADLARTGLDLGAVVHEDMDAASEP